MNQFPLITDKYNVLNEKNNDFNQIINLDKNDYINLNLETKYNVEEEEKNEEIKKSKTQNTKKEKILILEIITSVLDTKGKKIKIEPNGYPEGIRQIKDGKTFFGYEEPNKNKKEVRKNFFIMYFRN